MRLGREGGMSVDLERADSRAARWMGCAAIAVAIAGCAASTYGDPKAPVAGEVLGTVIRTQDAEELRYVVLKELTDRFALEQGITVTPAETDAYVRRMREALQKDRADNVARRDKLARELSAGGRSESERKALAAELDSTNRTIAALGPPDGAEMDAEEAKAREQVATAFIRQWKVNRALYRKYGGRIVFQQGGPEPLDAYRTFLEEQQARGNFRITDKRLETAFWRYYLTDEIHSFYPRGSKEETQAFEVPWWNER
jgi:hypothetical protein